jgi:hypothetical protein
MIAIKIGFFASRVFFDPLKFRFLDFFLIIVHRIVRLEVLKNKFRPKC